MNHLVVKFPWSLRQKPKDIQVQEAKPPSRNTIHVRKLKKEEKDKYQLLLQKDRIRAEERYVKIEDKSDAEKQNTRMKWAQSKYNHRKRKRDSENTSHEVQPVRKKVKEMSKEEKREYERNKKQRQRKNAAKKAPKNPPKNSRVPESSVSKATVYRKLKDIKNKMPISPKAYATVVDNLANKVTPRKKKEIQNRGLGKRNLFSEENEAPSDMGKHEKQKKKNRYERPKSSASVMTRYLLAKALRANN